MTVFGIHLLAVFGSFYMTAHTSLEDKSTE